MEKAKAAVSDFMAKAGKHDTTVHESVAPAVKHEQVKPTRHENITTAIDKEVHQDHYHHSVQPVHDREVLPEKHRTNLGAVEHRDFDNRDKSSVSRNLETERAKFKDEQVVHDTKHTQSVQPTVAGEHVHHHVHETIQPIIHKETVQPEVVHTTVPIHEVHHNAAQHHSTSHLPAVSLEEFKKQGGVLGGREERYDEFKGEPRNIGGALGSHLHKKNDSAHEHRHDHAHGQGLTGQGLTGQSHTGQGLTGQGYTGQGLTGQGHTGQGLTGQGHTGQGLTGQGHTGQGLTGQGLTGNTGTTRTGEVGTGVGARNTLDNTTRDHHTTGNPLGNTTRNGEYGAGSLGNTQHSTANNLGNTTHQQTGTAAGQKPSLASKLNPFTDSDRDGRRGIGE